MVAAAALHPRLQAMMFDRHKSPVRRRSEGSRGDLRFYLSPREQEQENEENGGEGDIISASRGEEMKDTAAQDEEMAMKRGRSFGRWFFGWRDDDRRHVRNMSGGEE